MNVVTTAKFGCESFFTTHVLLPIVYSFEVLSEAVSQGDNEKQINCEKNSLFFQFVNRRCFKLQRDTYVFVTVKWHICLNALCKYV